MGPRLVHNLEGSEQAKQRLEVILETLAGQLTVAQACECLGIKEAMFHRLRTRVLQAGLADLEPRLRGRPRREPTEAERHDDELAAEVQRLESELEMAELRQELAMVLPQFAPLEQPSEAMDREALKKTTQQRRKRRRRKPKRRRPR